MILWDFNEKIIQQHDLQDKGEWCKHGYSKEMVFIETFGIKFNLQMNPEKMTNPYCPDLKYIDSSKLADLKTQNTPFFTSLRYHIPPQTAVTFNTKDRFRYQKLYPSIDIYFWVHWIVGKYQNNGTIITVEPMNGIWKISFSELDKICENAPLHTYEQRINDDKGNAKGSYLLNMNDEKFIKQQ